MLRIRSGLRTISTADRYGFIDFSARVCPVFFLVRLVSGHNSIAYGLGILGKTLPEDPAAAAGGPVNLACATVGSHIGTYRATIRLRSVPHRAGFGTSYLTLPKSHSERSQIQVIRVYGTVQQRIDVVEQ